jgi:metalloendopeptidase OMA1, mitochondrial
MRRVVLAPNKPWPTDPREVRIGQYQQANCLEVLEGVSLKLLQCDGMTMAQIQELVPRVRESFASKELHLYSRMYVVYERKPRNGEDTTTTTTTTTTAAAAAAAGRTLAQPTPG